MYRAVSFALLLSGCATIGEGNHQTIAVTTSPAGASCEMRRDTEVVAAIAATPGSFEIRKSASEISIICWKYGYRPAAYAANSDFQFTALFGGPAGLMVDTGTGAAFRYEGNVHLVLPPNERFLDVKSR